MGKVNYIKRGISYLKRNGIKMTVSKAAERLARDRAEAGYEPYHADEKTLVHQRSYTFARPYRFSILVPVHNTDPVIFRRMLESVGDQTYGNWELILADSSDDETRRGIVLDFTEEYTMRCRDDFGGIHDKVRYVRTYGVSGISANTNEALRRAQGDYTALLDHDDVLENTALFDIMEAIEKREQTAHMTDQLARVMLVYTDEDKTDETGSVFFDANIKPDFDPVMLTTNNYICHFLAVKTDLAKSVGGFRPEYDGAQDHDFILRCIESIKREEIIHIPKVLYHWRSTEGSTSVNPDAKLYAYEAGRRAVADHLERAGIRAGVVKSPHLGFFDIEYEKPDHTFARVTPDMLKDPGKKVPDTEFLLVLSDDLVPLDPGNAARMMSCMQLHNVGAVTGKILGRNRKVESAGYEPDGRGGIKASFAGLPRNFSGYMHRASIDRLSAGFSPDCVLVRSEAVSTFYPNIVLKDGYDIYYMHRAVFRRRTGWKR